MHLLTLNIAVLMHSFLFIIHFSVVFLSSSKTPLEAININDDDSKIYAFINFKEFLNQIGF